eukprot:3728970-Pyramimonas_sp.AAC.1
MVWTDPRDNSAKQLRARPDQTLEVRNKQKVLGKLWEPTLAELKKHPRWSPEYKLGTNGPKGILFVTCPND